MGRTLVVTAFLLGMAVVAAPQDGKPINARCPVKGQAAKADITSSYEGKTVGFC